MSKLSLAPEQGEDRKCFTVRIDSRLMKTFSRFVSLYNASVNGESDKKLSRDRAIENAMREFLSKRVEDAVEELDGLKNELLEYT